MTVHSPLFNGSQMSHSAWGYTRTKLLPRSWEWSVPHCLMPLTRQIFYRRYVCDVAGTAGYQVDWLDEGTNPARTIHVEDSKDISVVPTELPSMGPR